MRQVKIDMKHDKWMQWNKANESKHWGPPKSIINEKCDLV